MDRSIVYPGQVPIETDLLQSNQNIMIGLAKLSQSIFGTGGMATGFGTTQTTVPSLAVLVAPGEIYSQQNLEATAVSSLPQDLTHSIVKQGILLDAATITITPPGTAGFSINYLIQVAYQDSDSGSTVLPYYNASNPPVAYSGPANSGAAQPTVRKGIAVVSAKAGTAATTGTQTTPAPDAGKLGLYVVTVANGAASILNANISAYAGAPLLAAPVTNGRLLGVQVFNTAGTFTYTPTPGTTRVRVKVLGGGGSGGGASTTAAGTSSGGGGGGNGGYAESLLATGFAGVTVTVGAGAAGNASSNGSAGGSSSFGALVTCGGGGGGGIVGQIGAYATTGGGAGGTATGGNIVNAPGNPGGSCIQYGAGNGFGAATYGSQFGGGAAQIGAQADGAAATGYGTGGGGGFNSASQGTARSGGAGSKGLVIVEEFA